MKQSWLTDCSVPSQRHAENQPTKPSNKATKTTPNKHTQTNKNQSKRTHTLDTSGERLLYSYSSLISAVRRPSASVLYPQRSNVVGASVYGASPPRPGESSAAEAQPAKGLRNRMHHSDGAHRAIPRSNCSSPLTPRGVPGLLRKVSTSWQRTAGFNTTCHIARRPGISI